MRALRQRRHAPGILVAVGLAGALALPGAVGAGASQQAQALSGRQARLGSREHAALMSLYALDSRLARARAALASLRGRLAAVRAEEQQVARDRGIAARAWNDSVEALGAQLRAIYEHGDDENALAVLFGSSSIDEAVSRLDAMRWSARLNRQTVEQTRAARHTLARLDIRLAARLDALRGLVAEAAATASSLEQARAERVAYIGSLRRRQVFAGRQIARLRAEAQEIAARSQTIGAPQQDTAAVSTPAPATPVAAPGRTLTVTATGYSLVGHTSSGMPVGWGVVAVDPSVIPLGTRLTIPGYGEGVAADTGGAVTGPTIDLWFPTSAQALSWGRRTITVTLH